MYVPRNAVWGNDLKEDLKICVGDNMPVCFDIGANKGQTIEFLLSVFHAPTIYAFEPLSDTFSALVQRFSQMNVFAHQAAMGANVGTMEINEFASSDLSSFLSLSDNPESRFNGGTPQKVRSVQVLTVDNFVQKNGIKRIDLLKSDTQGFEMEVLRGADKSLQVGLIRNIYLELNFIPIYDGQASPAEVFEFLKDKGFGLVDFYEKERHNNCIQWCNALFTLKSHG